MMKGYSLKQVDRHYDIHIQAWKNQEVQATTNDKKPKPVFDKFSKFFDYEKELKSVEKVYRQTPVDLDSGVRFRASVAEAERLLNERG